MNDLSSEWVSVSPLDFSDSETKRLHGVAFHVLPSPHSMPVALRSTRNPKLLEFSLEIKYLGDEQVATGTFAEGVEIHFGKRSYRPRKLVFKNQEKVSVDTFVSKVNAALDSFQKVNASVRNIAITLRFIRSAVYLHRSQLTAWKDCLES